MQLSLKQTYQQQKEAALSSNTATKKSVYLQSILHEKAVIFPKKKVNMFAYSPP